MMKFVLAFLITLLPGAAFAQFWGGPGAPTTTNLTVAGYNYNFTVTPTVQNSAYTANYSLGTFQYVWPLNGCGPG